MDEITRNTLELFIEKTERMLRYITSSNYLGGLFDTYSMDNGKTWDIHIEADGSILTFRRFIQREKTLDISLYPLRKNGSIDRPKLLDLPDVSDEWKQVVTTAWTKGSEFLTLDLPDVPFTRLQILEVFIYGDAIHPTKYKQFKAWKNDTVLYGKVVQHFKDVLGFLFFEHIQTVAEACRKELRK